MTGIAEKFSSCLVQKFYDAAVNFSAIQAVSKYVGQRELRKRTGRRWWRGRGGGGGEEEVVKEVGEEGRE